MHPTVSPQFEGAGGDIGMYRKMY